MGENRMVQIVCFIPCALPILADDDDKL